MTVKTASVPVELEGKKLALSNLSKTMYPAAGFKKSDVIRYYTEAAPVILPHLKDRLLTLKRYPDGVQKFFFYEKRCPQHRPAWIKTKCIPSREDKDPISYCVIDSLAGLVWVANLASLEFHTLLCTAKNVERPTMLVFDLDPGPAAVLKDCADVALRLRKTFTKLGNMLCFVKTSGKRGLHVYVPLNSAVTFDDTKTFARALAVHMEREDPAMISTNMRKDKRKGKVFMDWSQNDNHKTTVCVYSLRASEMPSVSMPMTWQEVESIYKGAPAGRFAFGPADLAARLKKHGDLFAPVLTLKQRLPHTKLKNGRES